jgi:hypothetical protein
MMFNIQKFDKVTGAFRFLLFTLQFHGMSPADVEEVNVMLHRSSRIKYNIEISSS